MTVIKQQKSLLFWPECLPSKYYIELIRVLKLTIGPMHDQIQIKRN